MNHAPATIKGGRRRRIVLAIENVIGMAIVFGSLLFVCTIATIAEAILGVR